MKATILSLGLAVLAGTAAELAGADRLVDYVAPSLLNESPCSTNNITPHTVTAAIPTQTVATRARSETATARWERFEAEFSIKQGNDSLILDTLQAAKYQFDKTTFLMQEWLYYIEQSLQFDYGLNDLGLPVPPAKPYRATGANSLVESVLGMRLQSDVHLNLAQESFVGVKLVLPLSN